MSARASDGGALSLPARVRDASRTLPPPGDRPRHRYRSSLRLVLAISLLTWGVFIALEAGGYRETADMASLDDIIDTSTVLLAAVVAALSLMRWRLGEEGDDLFVALGLLALGPVTVGFDNLVLPRLPEGAQASHLATMVTPLAFACTVAALAVPLLRERLGTRLRSAPVVAAVAGAVVAVGGASWFVPTVAHVVAGRRERAVAGAPEMAGQLVVALILLALAAGYWRRGRAQERTLYAWLGLALLVLAQSRLALAVTLPAGTLWLAASRILRLQGLLFLLLGANRELQERIASQQSALRSSQARVQSMEVQREAERKALEENRHDVRSALFAIGGVAELLGRRHDDLDAGTLEALTQALGAEVGRLQELVSEREREELQPFLVLEAISPVLLLERSNGLEVTCKVDARLAAFGRPKETTQVLRNLLDNARRYAPGSPVVVRSETRDEWVVLVVEDEGPGVPTGERKAVFQRAHRGSTADGTPGSGLGLYVGQRLMREQGGDLWVADRAGGPGAAFLMSLPVATERPQSPPPGSRRKRD